MATMGQRKVSEKKAGGKFTEPKKGGGQFIAPAPVLLPGATRLNVVIPTMQVEAIATVAIGSTLGIPIMRDGFVTETGLLPSSAAVSMRTSFLGYTV